MNDRTRALAGLIAVFLLGVVAGAGGIYAWMARVQASPPPTFGFRERPAPLPKLLELTPEQERQFRQIMRESREGIDAAREEQTPRLRELRNEMDRKIFAILSDEQKVKFAAFLKHMASRKDRLRRPGW